MVQISREGKDIIISSEGGASLINLNTWEEMRSALISLTFDSCIEGTAFVFVKSKKKFKKVSAEKLEGLKNQGKIVVYRDGERCLFCFGPTCHPIKRKDLEALLKDLGEYEEQMRCHGDPLCILRSYADSERSSEERLFIRVTKVNNEILKAVEELDKKNCLEKLYDDVKSDYYGEEGVLLVNVIKKVIKKGAGDVIEVPLKHLNEQNMIKLLSMSNGVVYAEGPQNHTNKVVNYMIFEYIC